jgi:hypothetical protein
VDLVGIDWTDARAQTAAVRRVRKVAMANQTRRRAVSTLLSSYTAKTGPSATVFYVRSVGLVIHRERNVPKEEMLQFD